MMWFHEGERLSSTVALGGLLLKHRTMFDIAGNRFLPALCSKTLKTTDLEDFSCLTRNFYKENRPPNSNERTKITY